MMLLGFAAHAQNPIAVRSTNGVATNLTALGTTTAGSLTVNTLVWSNATLPLGGATNSLTWVQTNWVENLVYSNGTGRMMRVKALVWASATDLPGPEQIGYQTVWITTGGAYLPRFQFGIPPNGLANYTLTNVVDFMVSNGVSFFFTNTGANPTAVLPSFTSGYLVQ